MDQRLDQVELPLHSQRVLADELITGLQQTGPSKELVEPVAGELGCQPELAGEEPGILVARHLVEVRGLVEHDAKPAPQRR